MILHEVPLRDVYAALHAHQTAHGCACVPPAVQARREDAVSARLRALLGGREP